MNVNTTTMPDPIPKRLQWWTNARFGISYHFGLYSLLGRGEWVQSTDQMDTAEYEQLADQFDPRELDFDEYARLAAEAGMRYAILTAKHHDGFCLFDTKLSRFNSVASRAGRDLVGEYVRAFRARGIRVGLYYSLVDWHHPDYGPVFGDRQHPMRNNASARGRSYEWLRYVRYIHGQVRELLENYGTIDLLVFDFSYNEFTGERWGATELLRMIRQIAPEIVINDRLSHAAAGNIKSVPRPAWAGDFDTCELNTPHAPTADANGQRLPWELWITHNNSWSHSPPDAEWKSAAAIIRTLVNCVSKSGNLTLNFGPAPDGRLPAESIALLKDIGSWLSRNGSSIYECGLAPMERPDWGRYTLSNDGNTLFAHVIEAPMGHLTLRHLKECVSQPKLVATQKDAVLTEFWNPGVQSFGSPDDIFLNIREPTMMTYSMPDPIDTVISMDFKFAAS